MAGAPPMPQRAAYARRSATRTARDCCKRLGHKTVVDRAFANTARRIKAENRLLTPLFRFCNAELIEADPILCYSTARRSAGGPSLGVDRTDRTATSLERTGTCGRNKLTGGCESLQPLIVHHK